MSKKLNVLAKESNIGRILFGEGKVRSKYKPVTKKKWTPVRTEGYKKCLGKNKELKNKKP